MPSPSWITSFFDNHNEVARDVRNNYLDYLRMGCTGRQATREALEGFPEAIIDNPANEPVMWIALAVTQWEYGRLEPRVKSRALKAIKNGGDVASYPADQQRQRSRVLDRVRAHLESPPPPEKRVRIIKPAEPLKKIERLWKAGQIVAFRQDSGRFVLLLTEGVVKHQYLGEVPYFALLKWEGARIPSDEKILKLRALDGVIGAYPNKRGAAVPWDRVQRLALTRQLTGNAVIDRVGVFCEDGLYEAQWNKLDEAIEELRAESQ